LTLSQIALAPTSVQQCGLPYAEDLASSILILLPSTKLQKLLLSSSTLRKQTILTAVYLRWNIKPSVTLRPTRPQKRLRLPESLQSLPLVKPGLSLSMLQVSPSINEFFCNSSHIPYFIWENVDPRNRVVLVETHLLINLLRGYRINPIQTLPEQGPVLLFIHTAHISKIGDLSGLVKRRSRLETTFFIYGIDAALTSQPSLIRYVFPAGLLLPYFHFPFFF
jgi:hypothetical protein